MLQVEAKTGQKRRAASWKDDVIDGANENGKSSAKAKAKTKHKVATMEIDNDEI